MVLLNDSEHSNRSTFEAAKVFHEDKSLFQHVAVTSCINAGKKSNRVRFDKSRNQTLKRSESVSIDVLQGNWYTNSDFRRMRVKMRNDIQELRKQEMKTRQDNSEELYSISKNPRELLDLVLSIDYIVHDASSILSSEVKRIQSQLYAKKWGADDSMEVIGLELHLDFCVRRAAKEYRENIQGVVYDIQQEHLAGLLKDDEVHLELQESCQNYSQAFGLFAYLTATAQLAAQ
ncbi:hypothetical protein ACA910_018555 [Epithemia clementina (nom. ined.)]